MSVYQSNCMKKARSFFKSLGGRVAGGYLRNQGFSLEDAVTMLGLPKRNFN